MPLPQLNQPGKLIKHAKNQPEAKSQLEAKKSPINKVSLTADASRLPLLADFVPNLPQAPSEWSVWESESRDKLVVAWQNVDQALKDLPKSHENVQQTCTAVQNNGIRDPCSTADIIDCPRLLQTSLNASVYRRKCSTVKVGLGWDGWDGYL